MPKTKRSELSHLQLGQYGEYYAKMEFTSYGFGVYTSEVDDHGVDFVAKKNGIFYEVQVKSIRNDNYMFIRKSKLVLDDKHLICYLRFVDDQLPEVYVILLLIPIFVDNPTLKMYYGYGGDFMLIALADYARRHGRDPVTARQRAGRGAFHSAVKIGRDWLIDDQEPWIDSRIHTGEYINARKQKKKRTRKNDRQQQT